MDILLFLGVIAVLALQILLLLRKPAPPDLRPVQDALRQEMQMQLNDLQNDLTVMVQALGDNNLHALEQLGQMLQTNQHLAVDTQYHQIAALERNFLAQTEQLRKTTLEQIGQMESSMGGQQTALRESVSTQIVQLQNGVARQMEQIEQRMGTLEKTNESKLEAMRGSITENMAALRSENNRKLDEIRGTVDEKLQTTLEKRITESFQTVSRQLEQVYKGLGEMQTLASDVGGLKKVLSGVKTRGILGEVQLGAILREILSPEQYECDIATIPGSKNRVEFAVRLPGPDGIVYLPIDSKFPGDRYAQLVEAQESGDKTAIDAAYKALETVIISEAKDIRTKYVDIPYTTSFGIMFLPFEGLYAEVVSRGLVEKLQRTHQVSVAGPSTMAAMLNSLQMGFRTLAIQKRSSEVWKVLGAVKTEFDKFEAGLTQMQKHLSMTSKDLDALMTTRTRAIQKQLNNVQQLDEPDTGRILEAEP